MQRRTSRGFTLIELLIVVVVIGILAAIAIPKFSSMREKAFIASITSDLKNVASQQEIYLSDSFTYASTVADLNVNLSEQVQVYINQADGTGWAATGTHPGLASGRQCGLFFGTASASNASPATVPGVVTCN